MLGRRVLCLALGLGVIFTTLSAETVNPNHGGGYTWQEERVMERERAEVRGWGGTCEPEELHVPVGDSSVSALDYK
jgi:hypothetical protein